MQLDNRERTEVERQDEENKILQGLNNREKQGERGRKNKNKEEKTVKMKRESF